MKNFERFIAGRLRVHKNTTGISQNSIIAIGGISIAFIVMLLSFSIVTGFKNEIRNKVIGFDSQISISPQLDFKDLNNSDFIVLNDTLKSIISQNLDHKANIALTLITPGILKTEDNYKAVIFKGADNNFNWDFISKNIIAGNIPDYNDSSNVYNIIISNATSKALNISVNDNIFAYFFVNGGIKSRKLKIAGIYNTHFGEFDEIYVFAPIEFTQKIANVNSDYGNNIEINNLNEDEINKYTQILNDSIFNAYHNNIIDYFPNIKNVYQKGAIYFNWLDMLDMNVIIILILMTFISGFTLISCLFIIILENVNTVGVLKSLGATNTQIKHIFIYIAEKLVLKGLLIGNIIGLFILFIQDYYKLIPLDADAYYLNYVPVDINWITIISLNIGVIITSILILLIPSHIISKISPIKTIKYE